MSRWAPLLALSLFLVGCRTDSKPDSMDTGRSVAGGLIGGTSPAVGGVGGRAPPPPKENPQN